MTWRVVVGAIQDSAERSGLVAALSAAGFSIEDFGRLLGPRETACDWLTRYEDRLEARHGTRMAAERLAVKTVRRRLESELFR